MIRWQVRLHQLPQESWTFVQANQTPYALFLSLRPGYSHWRGFVITNARRHTDLLHAAWSTDLLVEHFAQYRESELSQAQTRLVEIMAQRLSIDVSDIQPANSRASQQHRLTTAQIQQWAASQPGRRRP